MLLVHVVWGLHTYISNALQVAPAIQNLSRFLSLKKGYQVIYILASEHKYPCSILNKHLLTSEHLKINTHIVCIKFPNGLDIV